ncbi:MAG: MoxR family ATPase [Planctomycetota bacterium]|nr:MoxR family ATPase [Planctomycetota bacterium]
MSTVAADVIERAEKFRRSFERLKAEIAKVIVGHSDIIEGVISCMLAGGNCLLEGVPGLGKTMLIRTLAKAVDLRFSRIQFTPDLMPSDITGTTIVSETEDGRREFKFQPGPIFAQIVLADEINRATPKTQSALLEAMQEQSVTVGRTIYRLEQPFFVLATQNPLEMEGTYPLPEAQLDRFMFKLNVGYSSREELAEVITRTTEGVSIETARVMDGPEILAHRSFIERVLVPSQVKDYAVRLVLATHPGGRFAVGVTNRYVRFGSSPRGAQALIMGAKIRALLDSRYHISFEDVAAVAFPALRHRLILNFEAEAEGISPDDIVREVLAGVPKEVEDFPA